MCICLIQFQHNSYPCNTPRTLAYGYMRYKLGVWLKIIGVSISIIFHKIDSRGKKMHKQDHNPLQNESGKVPLMHTHTHTHGPLQTWRGTVRTHSPVNSQHCRLPLGSQPALLRLTCSQDPWVERGYLWCLSQRAAQSSRNKESELGSSHDDQSVPPWVI